MSLQICPKLYPAIFCVVEGTIHNDLPMGVWLVDFSVSREGIRPQDHKEDNLNHDFYW